MMRTAIFAGSFDPVTNGHLDIIRQAAPLCDRLVEAEAVHHGKKPLLSADERLAMIRAAAAPITAETGLQVEVRTFHGLVVDAAAENGATFMVRGLRTATDFDYETQMAGMNAKLRADVGTVCLLASPDCRAISSTLVRQIAMMGGDVSAFVPAAVAEALKKRAAQTGAN
jgi:pantetheine-phosphate adenylyltransferase